MTTQLAPNSMSLPPPVRLQFDLLDGNRRVGWVNDGTIGFRGFANETEAAHGAWVAYRTLSRRLARRHGGRPAPIDVEPLALARDGDREAIVASNRAVAYLVRPGVDSPSGADSFGFEIHVPLPPDELTMRSIAYRIYRTLRKSGIRWAMWDKRRVAAAHRAAERAHQPVPVPTRHANATALPGVHRLRGRDPSDEDMRTFGWFALGAVSLAVLMLAVLVPTELGMALAAIGLAGLVVFRLTAAWAGWLPRDVTYTRSRVRARASGRGPLYRSLG